MTICNTANDGWYHLLLTICDLVKLEKKLKIDDLFRVLTCDGEIDKDLLEKTKAPEKSSLFFFSGNPGPVVLQMQTMRSSSSYAVKYLHQQRKHMR